MLAPIITVAEEATVRFRLMPREESFFDMLEKASGNLNRAGKLLVEILRNPAELELSAKQMKAIEEEGDKIVHEGTCCICGGTSRSPGAWRGVWIRRRPEEPRTPKPARAGCAA